MSIITPLPTEVELVSIRIIARFTKRQMNEQLEANTFDYPAVPASFHAERMCCWIDNVPHVAENRSERRS